MIKAQTKPTFTEIMYIINLKSNVNLKEEAAAKSISAIDFTVTTVSFKCDYAILNA